MTCTKCGKEIKFNGCKCQLKEDGHAVAYHCTTRLSGTPEQKRWEAFLLANVPRYSDPIWEWAKPIISKICNDFNFKDIP